MTQTKLKLWLENEQEQIFGRGNLEILQAILKFGSINESAKQLKMNYKKVWNKKQETEEFLGGDIFISKKGASKDSGTSLSPKAIEIIKAFSTLESDVNSYAKLRFDELFSDIIEKKENR